jgi:hypothetical protein
VSDPVGVLLGKCLVCHVRFAPGDGPCPKCGSASTERYSAPPVATTLAATSLEVPPPGWEKPHALALVELEDGVRLLALVDGPLPRPGELLEIRLDGDLYHVRRGAAEEGKRGEGDVPGAGAVRPSFEPPR